MNELEVLTTPLHPLGASTLATGATTRELFSDADDRLAAQGVILGQRGAVTCVA